MILDESSLVPCGAWSHALRIQILASALKALDQLGCSRVLRSVRVAADQDIGQGRGLRGWCFDKETNREAGRFIAQRLGKQPFVDGADGLFAAAEGERAIEGRAWGNTVIGLALSALTGDPAVALGSATLPGCIAVNVELTSLDGDDEIQETVPVCCVVSEDDVNQKNAIIIEKVEQSVASGSHLLGHAAELFPRLRFGQTAEQQIAETAGNQPVFHQLFRHLRALDRGAASWRDETQYSPDGAISWSPESKATLDHSRYGPLRDFPVPHGFTPRRWSNHTKLSGGSGARLYFDAERTDEQAVVLIGYFGPHLRTAQDR